MEEIAWIVLVFICLNWFAYSLGITHAILYSRKGADALPGNEHKYYVEGIFAVCVSNFGATFLSTETYLIILLAFILSYSFWHNGAYYITRKKIDEPKIGWFYQSPTDTSHIHFGGLARSIMFILSIVILTTYITHKTHVKHPRTEPQRTRNQTHLQSRVGTMVSASVRSPQRQSKMQG